MNKSTHRIEIVRVKRIVPAPNSDNLEIIYPFGSGYQVVVKKGDFQVNDLAAYVPPDTIVPTTHPAFHFLKIEGRTEERVRVKRLRKNWSQGLLVPVRDLGLGIVVEGDDVSEALGTRRYEPPEPPQSKLTAKSVTVKKPRGFPIPTYDLEPLHRYGDLVHEGEDVVITEKIHGSQARYTFRFGEFHAGSKGVWRRVQKIPGWLSWWAPKFIRNLFPFDRSNAWTRVLAESQQLRDFLEAHPHWVVFGEVYGDGIQDMKYGCKPGEIRFAAFQILTEEGWLPQAVALGLLQTWRVPVVPVVYAGPYDGDTAYLSADGISLLPGAGHIREGVVITPSVPRVHPALNGPVHLKVVSNAYYERHA